MQELSIGSLKFITDECITDFMLPALKECKKLTSLVFDSNPNFCKMRTANLLLKECPYESLARLEILGATRGEGGEFDDEKWDEDGVLVKERMKKVWDFDGYVMYTYHV